MVEGVSEISAVLVGLVGLTGAAATTGLPMWKVTAFIGANIIVMETRWEGLWMNCYRQANIRMQCKVYDSLLYLPPELQASRGLMCCSVALAGVALLAAIVGMRCTSCIQENNRAKAIILMVAGGLQFLASLCVFIPVSWTGYVIIQDFYNPLLIDAQRRELGQALYIGWVTSAVLLASAVLFVSRNVPSNNGSFKVRPPAAVHGYAPAFNRPRLMRYQPISSISSFGSNPNQPALQSASFAGHHQAPLMQTVSVANHEAPMNPGAVYNPGLLPRGQLLYPSNVVNQPPFAGTGRSSYNSQQADPYSLRNMSNPAAFYQSSFHPSPQKPVFIRYSKYGIESRSDSEIRGGVYI